MEKNCIQWYTLALIYLTFTTSKIILPRNSHFPWRKKKKRLLRFPSTDGSSLHKRLGLNFFCSSYFVSSDSVQWMCADSRNLLCWFSSTILKCGIYYTLSYLLHSNRNNTFLCKWIWTDSTACWTSIKIDSETDLDVLNVMKIQEIYEKP